MNRRQLLNLSSGLMLSSLPWLSEPLFAQKSKAKPDKRPIALLLPLTGEHSALGTSMNNAAMLAQIAAKDADAQLVAFDTGGTAAGAARAAAQALKRDAAILLGPLTAGEARAAAGAAAGAVPLVAFSNDADLSVSGAHVFGITPGQVTTAVLRYARQRGVRRLLVIGDQTPWSKAASAAAIGVQGELGLDVRTIDVAAGQPLPAAGEVPDAVLIPGGGEGVLAAARQLRETGVQLLATMQGLDHRPVALAALNGAWLASIDPDVFSGFATEYEARHGGNPGAVTALAYDATTIALKLRAGGAISRAALFDPAGFDCVTGPVRFRTDGSCARQFALLTATGAGYEKVAVSQGT